MARTGPIDSTRCPRVRVPGETAQECLQLAGWQDYLFIRFWSYHVSAQLVNLPVSAVTSCWHFPLSIGHGLVLCLLLARVPSLLAGFPATLELVRACFPRAPRAKFGLKLPAWRRCKSSIYFGLSQPFQPSQLHRQIPFTKLFE